MTVQGRRKIKVTVQGQKEDKDVTVQGKKEVKV